MEIKELGHVVLYVRDLELARHFYGDVLGFRQIGDGHHWAAAFSSGRTHHELLLIGVGPDATPIPNGRRIGMYHFGLKVGDSLQELQDVVDHLKEHGVLITGTADHVVTLSVYIQDPDGNEIELYCDKHPEVWREHPEAMMAPPRPIEGLRI